MVKSPMEYFQEQDFSMEAPSDQEITQSERAFLKKYLGIDDASALQGLPPVEGVPVAGLALNAIRHAAASAAQVPPGPVFPVCAPAIETIVATAEVSGADEATPASGLSTVPVGEPVPSMPSVDEKLRDQEIVTLVGFYISGDVFVIPLDSVLEVIRYEEPFKLPMSPSFLPGVVNLRGRILPVVNLSELLIVPGSRPHAKPAGKTGLIIVCEGNGLQMGLQIDKLHTMFKARQNEINWNAEIHLGPSAELLSGLLETGEKLLGILSVERLVDKLLAS